jgi:osmotically inducible protein OsmC
MTTLYTTSVTVRGGRTGWAQSPDGRLDVALSMPREIGGAGGPGTNPEQLFAAGYAACFESALRLVARQQKVALPEETSVTAEVSLVRRPEALFSLAVTLTGNLPGLPRETARSLLDAAHQVCPFSNMIRGQFDLTVQLADSETSADAKAA